MHEPWERNGFGLYVHWPFCEAKCPYCDFNSHVASHIDHGAYLQAYLDELDRYAELTPGRRLDSIFFGGGTPSLMKPETVDVVIERATRHWPGANDMEITLEANPSSVEAGRFAGYRAAGVNRISMGVQALNDPDLRRLGRLHTVAEARSAFDTARGLFPRVSFDLIYGRQGQSLDAWRAELGEALAMAVDHLSLYQLTIEPGTAFGTRLANGGLKGLPDEDLSTDMFDATQEICAEAGLPAYEISNHARPGAESTHNLIYWRQGDYVAIGPGGHGRLTLNGRRYASECVSEPGRWLLGVKERQPVETWEEVCAEDYRTEKLLMGLRLSEGVEFKEFIKIDGDSGDRVRNLAELGLVWKENGRLGLTEKGRPLLNAVLREILA